MNGRQATGDFFEQGGRGMQSSALREANRRAVLTFLFIEPGSSMADISRLTGLAPQTTSAILVELEEEMLVKRGSPLRGRRGQPATPVFLDPDGVFAIGVELSWNHLEVVLINLGVEVLGQYRRGFQFPDATSVVSEITEVIKGFQEQLSDEQRKRLIGIGIALPSALEQHLLALGAPLEQVELWKKLDLPARVQVQSHLPTESFHGGNAGSWAELVSLKPPRPTCFAHLYLGTFLAGGIVSQNSIWDGPTGEAACFGSMLVADEDGTLVPAERIVSLSSLARMLRDKGVAVPLEDPTDWPWADWQDELAPWIERAAQAIATVIFNTTATVRCDHVIIDGALPKDIMDQLVEKTERQLRTIPGGEVVHPRLTQGHLGSHASALGAAELPVFRRYFSRDVLI